MAHQTFRNSLLLIMLIALPKISLADNDAEKCFDEETQYSVDSCLTNGLKKSILKYKKERSEFIALISNGIEGARKFKQIERESNKKWLSSIDSDCQMIAFKTGTEDSPLYNSGYTYCMLNKYNERISFLKFNHHL